MKSSDKTKASRDEAVGVSVPTGDAHRPGASPRRQPGPGAAAYNLYKPAMPQPQQADDEHGTPTHWQDLPG